jgi:Zn finger protein HypA/HybF involved in hydrogenase expression
MGKKLTDKEFKEKVFSNSNGTIIINSEYSDYNGLVNARCLICNNEWMVCAGGLCRSRKRGCPECGKKKAKDTVKWHITQEKFIAKIPNEFLDTIEILGKYEFQNYKLDVRCRTCNRIWSSTPTYLYKKWGCDDCKRKKKGLLSRKSHDVFLLEINQVHDGCIELLENYTTGENRILVRCLQCEHQWTPVAARLRRRGCPKCISSKGEKKIERILLENNVVYRQQLGFDDFRTIRGCKYKFDFGIFIQNNLSHLIEYDGQQHFKPVKIWGGMPRYLRQVELDRMKNEYCENKNIRLIRIPYTEFSKIDFRMLQ